MSPVNFDGCFSWLHAPKLDSRDTAVILCPGLKTDDLTDGLRLFADALADRGSPALRLHYPGTGNSTAVIST